MSWVSKGSFLRFSGVSREILDHRASVELGLKRFFSKVLWGEQRYLGPQSYSGAGSEKVLRFSGVSRVTLDHRAPLELGLKRFCSKVLWGEQRDFGPQSYCGAGSHKVLF